ncbi:Ribosomal protein l17, partial [Globisporangium splendens]
MTRGAVFHEDEHLALRAARAVGLRRDELDDLRVPEPLVRAGLAVDPLERRLALCEQPLQHHRLRGRRGRIFDEEDERRAALAQVLDDFDLAAADRRALADVLLDVPHTSESSDCVSSAQGEEMKKGIAFRKLNRTSAHRWAMLRTMTEQLVTHERIRTTLPKAKELRRVADQVVTLAKQGDEVAKKRAQAILRTPEAVDKLFDVFGKRYDLPLFSFAFTGLGDGAEMAVIEYIDRPGEMRKAKPPQGIAAIQAAFEAQTSQ